MKRTICPYPGLRPFTEEESIFFKGRDLHIRQIVKLLEENKMAFITGASGDGKSSMVYAGVVPYIRAGFFKAYFNSWIIADFKPQRNPLRSLSESLAKEIGIEKQECEEELQNGFSSIIDIYKKKNLYSQDPNKGKNLLIIADQFEEIFTNSDNFNDSQPSEESYTAINLLLETIRLSIIDNLPIYVIFTMRSDFISQCTVFKNLPEYIAYSQFFVPQLKRTEICQVIEEPALLAGGKVSKRLREILVNNLNNGFDQLPVLQHALNLLWKMADNGKKELDLIHLAKIAGISRDVLSEDEKKDFDSWFIKRPEYEKKYFEKPDLNNVLNAHAGILYESAFEYFLKNASWAQKNITQQESKEIIETTFKSLVKIDNNRPVRNRCTLDEITGMIGKENISNATVCGVINIFRNSDNTLLKPFIEDENLETKYLSGDTVLDITHEALIRNWKKLSSWCLEMETNEKDFQDFNSQLKRWLNSGKKKEFLLTEGNYGFVNAWYQRSRPNAYWLARYDNSKTTQKEKYKKALELFENSTEYLEESHNAIIEKEKAKKRRLRTVFIAIAVFLLTMTGFTSWALMEKSTADEQRQLAENQTQKTEEQRQLAEEQRFKAEKATNDAKIDRDNAQRAAAEAQKARNQVHDALIRANAALALAEERRIEAEENMKTAQKEREKAELEEHKARQEQIKAKTASDSAARLYNITLCNMLAMNAKNQYEDKELNIKLALAAYKLNEKNQDKQNDAILYDALLYAVEQTAITSDIKNLPRDIINFRTNSQNRLLTINELGQIIIYSLNNNKAKPIKVLQGYDNNKTQVLSAFFPSENCIVWSTKNKSTFFSDIKENYITEISAPKDYLMSAFIKDSKLVMAYSSGKIVSTNPYQSQAKTTEEINIKQKITAICPTKNPLETYILMHEGILYKYNSENKTLTKIIDNQTEEIHAFSMIEIPDKNLLAVSFSDGNIFFVNTLNDQVEKKRAGGHSQIEKMYYDENTELLAISSADKRISLLDTKNIENGKIVSIEEHSLKGYKVKQMSFNSHGVIFALTEENLLRYWETDFKHYADILKRLNPKPLTSTEKELILGKEFSKIEDL